MPPRVTFFYCLLYRGHFIRNINSAFILTFTVGMISSEIYDYKNIPLIPVVNNACPYLRRCLWFCLLRQQSSQRLFKSLLKSLLQRLQRLFESLLKSLWWFLFSQQSSQKSKKLCCRNNHVENNDCHCNKRNRNLCSND